MSFSTPQWLAYVILFTILTLFAILGILSSDIFPLPEKIRSAIVLSNQNTPDFFLSARNSASTLSIALSFFASGMGAWVVYGTTEMGATPALSVLGVLGYSGASSFPAILICWLGPRVRELTSLGGEKFQCFSTTDFVALRYGRAMQVITAVVSVFYMFIFLVAELTSVSNVYALLVGLDATSESTKGYTTGIAVSVGAFTFLYTSMAGLPASIATDRAQGVLMLCMVVLLAGSVPQGHTEESAQVYRENFRFTLEGFVAAVTLFIAIACAELFNQGTWQRVWAAKGVEELRKGFLWGSFLVFLLMLFFGQMGMIAYSRDPKSYDSGQKWAFLSFFDVLEPLPGFWHAIVLILITALAASTIDTLENALASVFSRDLVQGMGDDKAKWISRALVLLVNVPAVLLSVMRYDVIALFLVADLVCATSVFPVFLGLWTREERWGLVPPTQIGAVCGCIAGVFAVVINGAVVGENGEGAFGFFSYFWLRNGGVCALCGYKTMVTFIVTPLVSLIATLLVSKLEVVARGAGVTKNHFAALEEEADAALGQGKVAPTGDLEMISE